MPRATRVRHLHGALPGSPLPAAQEQRAAQSIDGNQVSLEVEMLRAQLHQMDAHHAAVAGMSAPPPAHAAPAPAAEPLQPAVEKAVAAPQPEPAQAAVQQPAAAVPLQGAAADAAAAPPAPVVPASEPHAVAAQAAPEPELPEAIVKVRQWWSDLQAICPSAEAHTNGSQQDAEAVVRDLKALFEAYPDLLRSMLVDGHVAALCNQLHCPPDLRYVPHICSYSSLTYLAICPFRSDTEPVELYAQAAVSF